jgi:hypothetical protein
MYCWMRFESHPWFLFLTSFFLFHRLDIRQKNVIIIVIVVVVCFNQIRSTDAIYPSIGVWSSVFFVGRKQLKKRKRIGLFEMISGSGVELSNSYDMYEQMTSSEEKTRRI